MRALSRPARARYKGGGPTLPPSDAPTRLPSAPAGELLVPMSIAVLGGLTVSTPLTPVAVPSFYLIADDAKAFLRRHQAGTPSSSGRLESPCRVGIPALESPSTI